MYATWLKFKGWRYLKKSKNELTRSDQGKEFYMYRERKIEVVCQKKVEKTKQ